MRTEIVLWVGLWSDTSFYFRLLLISGLLWHPKTFLPNTHQRTPVPGGDPSGLSTVLGGMFSHSWFRLTREIIPVLYENLPPVPHKTDKTQALGLRIFISLLSLGMQDVAIRPLILTMAPTWVVVVWYCDRWLGSNVFFSSGRNLVALVVLGLDPATSEFSCHKSTSVDNFTAAYSEVAA